MKLLLFDIDGTLLISQGAGRRAVESALSRHVGASISLSNVSLSGRTDWQIIEEVLEAHGIAPTDQTVEAALHAYADAASTTVDTRSVEILPGVQPLIEHLHHRADVQLGLVTGNVEPMAYAKLGAVDLDAYFPFGAFGNDHADRSRLPPLALERARSHAGHAFEGRHAVVIGDTQHDITCSRSIDATSVAVCTGRYTRDDLSPHDPDHLLDDLRDTDAVLERLLPEDAPRSSV
jgi:phosphoglycolate phosphatase-like HAD superfamily hydrolase